MSDVMVVVPVVGGQELARVGVGDFARVRVVVEVDVCPPLAEKSGLSPFAVYAVRSLEGDPTDREDGAEYRTHLWRVGLADGEAPAPAPLTHGERGGS
ncbi:MAG TPA: hypothetical protein VJP77_08600, partial [Planctomycetota bacterium]|nr:hypothetical protein [Planctomycetota bacterium]